MLHLGFSLLALGGLVFAGNWYVAAYGTIDSAPTHQRPAVTNFAECVAAGYPVMESYPEQCRTNAGEVFVNPAVSVPMQREPAPATEEAPAAADEADQLAAVAAVRAQAAIDLNVTESMIDVTSVTQSDWPDGCLGLPAPEEMCIMMLTRGYEVTLTASDKQATYRTDQTGAVVKKK